MHVQHVNAADPDDASGVVRLRDFFYWREHLILVTELLHLNLYQCLKRAAELQEPYFTVGRVHAIARQVCTKCLRLYLGMRCGPLHAAMQWVRDYLAVCSIVATGIAFLCAHRGPLVLCCWLRQHMRAAAALTKLPGCFSVSLLCMLKHHARRPLP